MSKTDFATAKLDATITVCTTKHTTPQVLQVLQQLVPR